MEPSCKRLRHRDRKHKGENSLRYDELTDIQSAQIERDSLGSLATRKALDDFLSTRRPSETVKEQVQTCLRLIKASLDSLPQESLEICSKSEETIRLMRQLAPAFAPESLFRSSEDGSSVKCKPPTKVNVVGSFLLGYSSCNSTTTDLAIEMPLGMFLAKRDIVNYMYHDKRLLYLLYVANHLLNIAGNEWVNLSLTKAYLASSPDKPTLTLSHKHHPDVCIRLIPTIPNDLFDYKRLGEKRKNVRAPGESPIVEKKSEATTAYNHSILADSAVLANLQTLNSTIQSTPGFIDAVLLLEAWNIRHRFNLTKFTFAALIANLLCKSLIPQRASKEHILRCVFNAIRSRALFDLKLNTVRVCASVHRSTLNRLVECASTALVIIESKTAAIDPWNGVVPYLFASARGMKSVPLPLSSLFDGFVTFYDSGGKSLSFEMVGRVEKILQEGLVQTRRLRQVEPIGNGIYGLTFASHQAVMRKLDTIDPDADQREFRSFWGSKTSLRRFKHGKVALSLIWSGGIRTLNEIMQYLMQLHFASNANIKCKVFLGELEAASRLFKGETDAGTNVAISAFNELCTLLRSIEGLPLKIYSVHATSPHIRRCGMYSIRPNESNRFIEPLQVVVKLESSSAWPDDAVALTASKAAFYVGLRSKLIEQGVEASATISYLDINLGNVVFWLRAYVAKEGELLEGTDEGEKLMWETETLVQHHDDIRTIETYPMAHVCRLAKLWLNTQLLFRCLGERRDSIVELLVASVMCNPLLGSVKSSMRGFCQFLHILSSFPWEVCPLVVQFADNDDTTMNGAGDNDGPAKRKEDENRHEAIRQAQKHFDSVKDVFGLYVAHGEMVEPWLSGNNAVDGFISRRLRQTATAAVDFIEAYLTTVDDQGAKLSLQTLFAADTDSLDGTLTLNKQACVMKPQSPKSIMYYRDGKGFLAGFDPVEHLWTDLEKRLGKWALFLGRMRSGSSLHIVWKPVEQKVRFSLRESAFCDLVVDDLQHSKRQLLEEMKNIGQGLVEAVKL